MTSQRSAASTAARTVFGERLRHYRNELNLSQSELAGQVGISPSYLSAWESGSREPGIGDVVTLAAVFHVATDDLLGVSNALPPSYQALYSSLDKAEAAIQKGRALLSGGKD